MALRAVFASDCLALHWNFRKFGMAMAARMPMMATTIISSMSVKPLVTFLRLDILTPVGWAQIALLACGASTSTVRAIASTHDQTAFSLAGKTVGDKLCHNSAPGSP